jgi:hypothetical protein
VRCSLVQIVPARRGHSWLTSVGTTSQTDHVAAPVDDITLRASSCARCMHIHGRILGLLCFSSTWICIKPNIAYVRVIFFRVANRCLGCRLIRLVWTGVASGVASWRALRIARLSVLLSASISDQRPLCTVVQNSSYHGS